MIVAAPATWRRWCRHKQGIIAHDSECRPVITNTLLSGPISRIAANASVVPQHAYYTVHNYTPTYRVRPVSDAIQLSRSSRHTRSLPYFPGPADLSLTGAALGIATYTSKRMRLFLVTVTEPRVMPPHLNTYNLHHYAVYIPSTQANTHTSSPDFSSARHCTQITSVHHRELQRSLSADQPVTPPVARGCSQRVPGVRPRTRTPRPSSHDVRPEWRGVPT